MTEQKPTFTTSFIDRINTRLTTLPLPGWVVYAVLGTLLSVIHLAFLWLAGGVQNLELVPIIIFNSFFIAFLLGLMEYLDRQAVSALLSMRPVMDTTETEFQEYQFGLSHMPFAPSLLIGILMLAVVVLMEQLAVVPLRYAALEQLPNFNIAYQVIDKTSAFLFGVFMYHTVRQLRMVTRINATLVRINLFNLRPLLSFSRLTASTAIGLVIGVYGWMLINPDLLSEPVVIVFTVMISLMAVAVFVLPLVGVHRRMEKEKENLLTDLDSQFETAFSRFNKGLQEEDHQSVTELTSIISALEIQQNKIKAIPTWPWRPETAQFSLTAIAIPLLLTILRFFVEQALN